VFWWGNLVERAHLENPCIDGRIVIRYLQDRGAWTGLIWLRIGTGVRYL
jgi:hypothetical protein